MTVMVGRVEYRYEVWAGRPIPERPTSSRQHSLRKFKTRKAAMCHAESLPNDDHHQVVIVTGFSSVDGWKPHSIARRRDGEWEPKP